MSGPTNYSSDGQELFTEQKPAIVQLADLMDYINEMRDVYDDVQNVYKKLYELLGYVDEGSIIKTIEKTRFLSNAKKPLAIPTYDGSNQTVHPKVLYFASGWNGWKYWMAHTPYPLSNDDFENPCIAVSNDGIVWVEPTGLTNPIDIPTTEQLADTYHMSDTHLVFKDGVLECWYRLNKNGVNDQILRKTTTNGVTWGTREVMHEVTGNSLTLSPAILHDSSKYRMWYVTENFEVKYEESNNGTTWSVPVTVNITFSGESVTYRAWHLDVVKEGSDYILIVNAGQNAQPFDSDRKALFIGKSSNHLSFTVKLIMLPTPLNGSTWDGFQLYRSTLVNVSGLYRLYYSAMSASNRWKIGLSEGYDLETFIGSDIASREGDVRGIDAKFIGDYYAIKGRKYYTHQQSAYLTNDEIKLLNPGNYGARLKVVGTDKIAVRTDNDGNYGDFTGRDFLATGKFLAGTNGAFYASQYLKLVNLGVAGVQFKAGTMVNTVEVRNDNDTDFGYLRTNGVQFSGNQPVPSDLENGMVRYFPSTKLLQMYDKDLGVWFTFQQIRKGNTRPTNNLETGFMWFDNNLNKPVWRNKNNDGWVDATGATV